MIDAPWPEVDEGALVQHTLELIVQVNGKVRGKVKVNAAATEAEIQDGALNNENVKRFLEGSTIDKVIVVKGRLVNIVVK